MLLRTIERLLADDPSEPAMRYDVLTANSRPFFYDRWALRSRALQMDYDCLSDGQQVRARGSCAEYALDVSPTAPPVEVDSAYGGLALYRLDALRKRGAASCRYDGMGHACPCRLGGSGCRCGRWPRCEHVAFHECLRRHGLRLAILPSLATHYYAASMAPSASLRVRVSVRSDGTVRTCRRKRSDSRNFRCR